MELNESMSLDEIRVFFSNDRFASDAGMMIEDARSGYALCSVELDERHRNAMGGVMGGVYFTIADLAFAVGSNLGGRPTVNVHSSIQYLSPAKGKRLTAEARCQKDGRSLCFYEVRVSSDERLCAIVTITGSHL